MNAPKKGVAGLTPDNASNETSNPNGVPAVNRVAERLWDWDGAGFVQVVNGVAATEFDQPEPPSVLAHLTDRERRAWELRAFAVRYVAGIEPRTFRDVAAELGVSHVAVYKVYRDVLAKIGALGIYLKAEVRAQEASRKEAA